MDAFDDDPKIARLPMRGPTLEREPGAEVRREVEQLLAAAESDIAPEPRPAPPLPEPAPPVVVVVPEAPKGPPPQHRNAMICPQCDEWTWRATQKCVHCGLDLFVHAQREQGARYLAWKAERDQKLTVWAVWLGGGGVLAIFASSKVSGTLGVLMTLAGMAAIFGAFVCGKVLEQDTKRGRSK